jgi:rare lipoprotein A
MRIRRKTSIMNRKSPLQFWLLVGASCVAMAGVELTLSTSTVQADALLRKPATSTSPAANATPASLAPQKSAGKTPADMLHGVASWYGSVFNGRHTASGERFDMFAMTACHPTLPFGTRVRVVNLANHRSVIVRITDRGDLFEGRVIDLSYGAAQKLRMTADGLAPVALEVIAGEHSHNK